MNVQTITMPYKEARAEFNKYRTATIDKKTPEWEKQDLALVQGYKAMMRGQKLINLNQVMKVAGVRPRDLLPRFAIARAYSKLIFVSMEHDGAAHFSIKGHANWSGNFSKKNCVTFRADTFPRFEYSQKRLTKAQTLVPIIPPNLRPKRGKIENYHVFWEVEEWTNYAPRDPMLLKFLGGELWAVLAVWDLTELERAVLGAPAN